MCDSEVDDFHAAVLQNHNVSRLDITMNDAPLVRVRQASQTSRMKLIWSSNGRDRFDLDHGIQRLALQVLHHEIGTALVVPQLVDGNDISMV